ncbi:XRE family transcriptional regulator [Streptomyces sp. NBC_00572]|uniref:helix-turn-helix domain-containing protein n=1 Tax=Streptomyces sp. NBC_00572 TaxID=2903664 RepID=UPI00225A985A|nr:XRE family transcriptional regulator [Streptomyces sp. NBC_00572]MCX4982953.1 XRE family transcriptional regulator [Streptomyces sp. NBC_00572]
MAGWKALPEELDPDVRAFTERLRRLIDRSGLGVTAVAERTGHERSAWDAYLNGRQSVPRSAVVALAEVTGSDPAGLATDWERAERAWARSAALVEGRGGGRGEPGPGPEPDPESGPEFRPGPGPEPGPEPEDGDGRGGGIGGGFGASGDVGVAGVAGDAVDARGDRTLQIRRVDPPRPTVPSAPAAAVPPPRDPGPDSDSAAPSARTPDSPRRKVLLYAAGILGALLVVTAALLLVDLGGSDGGDDRVAAPPTTTTAPPATQRPSLPPGVNCAGADCTGQDPEAMGCGGALATTVALARVGTAQVEVRYSETCGASWARLTQGSPGDTVTIRVGDNTRRATVAPGTDTAAVETDAYTPMVAVGSGTAARACGLLADGSEGCTANP